MSDVAQNKAITSMALDDIQDAILIFMRAVEVIDSGLVKSGRDEAMAAIGLLFEAESKMQVMGEAK